MMAQENSERLSTAVAELRQRNGGAPSAGAREAEAFALLEKRLDDAIARIDAMPRLDAPQRVSLADRLMRLRQAAAGRGVQVFMT